jgi:hypothetical protein
VSRALPRTLRRAAVGSAAALALVAGLLAAPAQAAPGDDLPATTECPEILPTSAIKAGDTGTGLTVVRGTEPKPFAVEVLGVRKNGIGAGKDLIIIEASDLPGEEKVISVGGGIWSGMSGSPVYINGKLIGAVAYGFSLAPSPIGGVTPAAYMDALLKLPRSAVARQGTAAASPAAEVSLSAAERRGLNARARAAVPSGSLRALPTPMTVGGLAPKRVEQFQAEADAAGLSVIARGGNTTAAPAVEAEPEARPEAGGNFAAALSYGDLTAAGVGTTTLVCRDQALAFGHPFGWSGPVSYGANGGNSLAIIKDDTFGSFKLADVGPLFGTVDQDRLAGLRADLDQGPALVPVRSTIRNVDTGRRRVGETRAADKTQLPGLTAFGLLANYDAVFDEIGDGRANTDWTITGRRAGGKPFTLTRGNKFASRGDIAFEAAADPALAVDTLLTNEFEPVSIDRVDFRSTVSSVYRDYTITKMEVSVDGGKFTTPRVLSVKGGALLRIRVSLRPYRSTALETTTLTMRVPRQKGRVGTLRVTGGATLAQPEEKEEEEGCLISPEACEDPGESSLDSILSDLRDQWRNDQVAARLVLEADRPGQKSIRKTGKKRVAEVVYGDKGLEIQIR